MRVLLADVNCKYSSTGKIVYDLYTQLRADGHEAAICYGRGPLVEGENIYRFSPKWEVYLHALLTRLTGYTGCFSPITTRRLLKYIDKFQPDIVHLHDMHGYFVNIIPLIEYLKKKRIKTVWTQHCEFLYTGKCGYAYECEKWKTMCENCPHLKDYPRVDTFDRTKKMFLQKRQAFQDFENIKLITPSRWLEARIGLSFLKDKPIQVIYNGIDTSIFYRRDVRCLREKYHLHSVKIVLAVAPDLMSERKGGKYVVELARRMESSDVSFIMVGVEEASEIQRNNIFVEGVIRDQDLLAEYYSLADVFLICSKRENYPTTCVEAAACGTPVVGFDVGGTVETVSGNGGIFVKYGDMDALERAVRTVLFDYAAGMTYCSTKDYSKDNMYRQYLRAYMEWEQED